MASAPVDPLLTALRDSGRLSADQVAAAERAFADAGENPTDLAERLNAAGALTRYQYKKVQAGRAADLLFGPYLLLDKIGEGGMGKVYRAVQLRMNRLVALKVVRPQLMANKTVVKRYEREAAAAAKLDHPNIVKLFDAELTEGRYYLAMEYVEGLDLSKLVKQFGPLPYQEACEYIRQSALGLHHAHTQSLIHRDIKPSNLLVSGERALPGTNGKASVKILDMGLVRSTLDDDGGGPDLTRDGTVVGTPDYMSPEQAKNSSTVTPAADIYSLGCTLYYLITGKPPYPEGTPVEKLIKHQLDQFPDIRKLVPSVPAGLARVLADMTAKRVSDRTPTAEAVALAIAPYTPNGDRFDLFSPTPGPASVASRTPRYEAVDFAPAPAPASVIRPVAVAAVATPPTPPATRTPSAATAAPATTRTARPKAIPLPTPEPDPISAESIPAGEVRKTPRPVGTVRVRKPKAKPEKAKPFPTVVVAGCVLAAVLVIGLIALVLHKPAAVEPPKPVEPPPVVEPPAPPKPSSARAVEDLLADHSTAVLIGNAKPLFDRLDRDAKFGGKYSRAEARLRSHFLFDLRRVDRIVVSFTGDKSGFVAAGDGGYLKPEWAEELDKYPSSKLKVKKDTDARRLSFPLVVQPKNPLKKELVCETHGAVLSGSPVTYLLSDRDELLTRLARRNAATHSPATDVPAELVREVQAAVARQPLAFFAAAGGYRLPAKGGWVKGDTLASLGVSLLTIEARLDRKLVLDVTVTGEALDKIRDFLNVELKKRLNDWSPALRPLAEASVAVAPELAPASGGGLRMTLTVTLDWEAVPPILETLLSPYAN